MIALELERAGLGHLVEPWTDAVRKAGVCTMDPDLSAWLREFAPLPPNSPLSLKSMALAMLPSAKQLLHRHHAAAADAQMTWLLFQEIAKLCLR